MCQSANFQIRTPRLLLTKVSLADLEELVAFKSDPKSFSHMLGGVRSRAETAAELERDLIFWQTYNVGMFTLRLAAENSGGGQGCFVGMAGLHQRPDWSGFALRFAISPPFRGRGMGKEAASSALDFMFKSGVPSVIALAREDNLPSRHILDNIGMSARGIFLRKGVPMWIYEAKAPSKNVGLK